MATHAVLFGQTLLADLFTDINPDNRFVLMLVGIGCLTGIIISAVTIISGALQSVHRTRLEAELKRDMLDRGMSAEEIAKVIESSTPRDYLDRWASRKKTA